MCLHVPPAPCLSNSGSRLDALCIGVPVGGHQRSRTSQAKMLISGICPKHSFKKAANSFECRVPFATSS